MGKEKPIIFLLVLTMNVLNHLHTDVWMSPTLSSVGYKYFVTFVDDYSRYTCQV